MFNIMKKTTLATLAALTLVSAVSAPAFAQQSNFNQRNQIVRQDNNNCLLYTSPSPRDGLLSRMPSSA